MPILELMLIKRSLLGQERRLPVHTRLARGHMLPWLVKLGRWSLELLWFIILIVNYTK